MNKNRFHKAFTLSEVLITLGIIGVVAALTIPNVIASQKEQATISALKKAYATLSQAYTLSVQENGTPDNWDVAGASGAKDMFNKLAPYLRVTKNCSNQGGCFTPNVTHKEINGADIQRYNDADPATNVALLQDGMMLATYPLGSCSNVYGTTPALKNVCGVYKVDINGFKGPNVIGQDFFYFYLTTNGIVPYGTQQDSANTFDSRCNYLKNASAQGHSCTAWVLYNENMDYMKCSDLAWGSKLKCS